MGRGLLSGLGRIGALGPSSPFFCSNFFFFCFLYNFCKKAPNQFKPISKFSKIKDNVLRQQKNNKTNFVIKL
jgi:hypothetical protein